MREGLHIGPGTAVGMQDAVHDAGASALANAYEHTSRASALST